MQNYLTKKRNMRSGFKQKKGFIALIIIVLVFIISAVVMWLWNTVLLEVIGVKEVTYWQAMGILVLSRILFGRFGNQNRSSFTKKGVKDEFSDLSIEEKMVLKQKWKDSKD